MNPESAVVARAQPLQGWRPERNEAVQTVVDARLSLALPAGLGEGDPLPLRPQAVPETAPQAGPSTETALGTTAQLLSRLAGGVPADARHAVAVRTAAPLSNAPGDARQVAAGLRDAIRSSGLFYESHLADWVDGAAGKVDLQREPQAALADLPRPGAGLGAQAESLVQRQLDVHEHRAVAWQGEAWPGRPAEVRIAEDDTGGGTQAGGGRGWQATLKVSMPGVGDVEARLSLSGSIARLALGTGSAAGSQALAAARGDLARALGDRGLTLAELKVDHGTAERPL